VKTLKIEELQSSLEAHELMVSERSSERLIQQALQVQTVKNDEYDKKSFKKGKNNSKGGNQSNSKGKNKASVIELQAIYVVALSDFTAAEVGLAIKQMKSNDTPDGLTSLFINPKGKYSSRYY
jgi:hypothetical protein